MSGEWKPGAIVRATVRGVPDILLICRHNVWASGVAIDNGLIHAHDEVTNHRPQIVLDPADPDVKWFLSNPVGASVSLSLIDKMRAQIEPPAPPKPDEPQSRGAVVADRSGNEWVRVHPGGTAWVNGYQRWAPYAEIDAVTVLSEGIA